MAAYSSWRTTDPISGIDFNQTYATANQIAASAVSSTGNLEEAFLPGDSLGTCRKGTNDSEWVLVKASTTINQYNLVYWDDSFNANNFTTASAIGGKAINLGVAQFTNYQGATVTSADPSTNPVFWAAVRGAGMQINVSGSAGTGVQLNSGTSAGTVSISTTGTGVYGIMLYASAASGIVECSVRYPYATAFAG